MIKVRRPAILFAVISAFYWAGIALFWSAVTQLPYHPYWLTVLTSTLPPMLYAVAALWFCGWLARRVMRQVAALKAVSDGRHTE